MAQYEALPVYPPNHYLVCELARYVRDQEDQGAGGERRARQGLRGSDDAAAFRPCLRLQYP